MGTKRVIFYLFRRHIVTKLSETAEALWPLVSQIVDKFGTKFVGALVASGLIGWFVYASKLDALYATIALVVLWGLYFFARRAQEAEKVEAQKIIALSAQEGEKK